MACKGRILQLQHYSVNDGDGIRTIVFFAGCPLRCQWCANPEGYTANNQIFYIASRCTHCGSCEAVCPQQISWDFQDPAACSRCIGCGLCASVCAEQARKNTVTEYTVEEIVQQLESQRMFFRQSGGGVTYSGGECTSQPVFLHALVQEVYDMGLNQAMETSGYFDLNTVWPILEKIDLLFMDIKVMDRHLYQQVTGVDNERILQNIAAIGARRTGIVIRVPTIMGVNGDDENIRQTARFVKRHIQEPKMELLPYHQYGADKYDQLGMSYSDADFRTPTSEELAHLNGILEAEGVQVVSFK